MNNKDLQNVCSAEETLYMVCEVRAHEEGENQWLVQGTEDAVRNYIVECFNTIINGSGHKKATVEDVTTDGPLVQEGELLLKVGDGWECYAVSAEPAKYWTKKLDANGKVITNQ